MDNQLVEGGNGSWSYSPLKYWPQSGALYFSAYAPYATADNGITPSYNTTTRTFDLSYALPADEDDQVDLLMAANVDVADCASRPSNVQFTFGHILSRVGLTARYSGSVTTGTTVTLTDVKISGKFVASGDYIVSGGWDNRSASASTIIYDRPAAKLAATTLTTSAQNLLSGDNYVMVIPNEDEVEVEGTITVYYTVTTPDGISMNYVKDASASLAYEPNKTYLYNLIIDIAADAIQFGDVTVSDWGTTVSGDVEVRGYSSNIAVVGLSFSPARRDAQFYVRSFVEYEDDETQNVPWHAEFSTDNGLTYSRDIPNFFTSIDNYGEGTNTYSASSNSNTGDYVDVKFVQDIEQGATTFTRAIVNPIIETRDSLIRGYHLRNTVLNKDNEDWKIVKVLNPLDYLTWAQNDIPGRYFSFKKLQDYVNEPVQYSIMAKSYLDYTYHQFFYNNEEMIVPHPKDWYRIISEPEEKGTLINGMLSRSHFACIQLDLSDTEFSELTNGEVYYNNKGYLNGLLIFPDDATINMGSFTLTCDNNNELPINNAINFIVYDCTENRLSINELIALMDGGCVFFPLIYCGKNSQNAFLWQYSKDGVFISSSKANHGGIYDPYLVIRSASSGYYLYEVRLDDEVPSNLSAPETIVYTIPKNESEGKWQSN